jgi:transposase InsO family protein
MAKSATKRVSKRGRRYTAAQRQEAMELSGEVGSAAAAAKLGMSERAIQYWLGAAGRHGRAGKKPPSAPAVSPPKVSAGATRSASKRARHGRRFSAAEKREILAAAQTNGVAAAALEFHTSRWSIYEWRRRQKAAKGKPAALEPRSSKPMRNGRALPEERYQRIAETWKANQALGPRQVRNLLRRNHGLRVGTSTVRRVMEEHGYVPPKIKVEQREVRRYEAVRPSQQVHLDFLHFFVHKAKCYLLLIEDDYSRFITGWALCEGERAQSVLEAVEAAIARHGKPEQIVVDGGSGFFAWRGESQLERLCGDYGIDFIKASKRGANSKLEALNANVRKELLGRVEFADLAAAREQIARWVRSYNFERVHEGLGGLLVPADRFFGRVEEVLAQIERGDPVVVPGAAPPDDRALDLFRVVSRCGRAELWLLGQRVWPVAPPTS